jgi:ubiquitin carboxyl-terminal hydrolase 8
MFKYIFLNYYKKMNYRNKGLTGLANLGNTCFINSCLQVLSNTYELNDFLNNSTYQNKLNRIPDSAILYEWDLLRQMMWEKNGVVAPNRFVGAIQKISKIKNRDMFAGFAQNDLPEFLIFLIDCFHNALSRKVQMSIVGKADNETDEMAIKCYETIKNMYSNEYSEIWNLFYGVHVSILTSIETNRALRYTPEPYFMINLPIPENNKSPSLIDCFDLYVKPELMGGDNAIINEKTGLKEDISKNISFWSFPNILAIDLKRFNYQNKKNQILVTFPIDNLNLSEYVVGYKKEEYIYDLYGICNHSGGVLGGHYTAFIKNANRRWYHYNDTHVNEITKISDLITPKAYCFFYRKKTV